ncbi:MAG TPA: DUF3322 domain-containing protein [Nitrosomonas sp.]|nr:DUF3322 domain-containing protein [Nitrosomonas sp.]
MNWTTTKELRQQVQQLWDKGRLLASLLEDDPFFPRRLILKTPTSRELSEHYAEVRHWIAGLQKTGFFRIDTKTIRHSVLGENTIPHTAWLDSMENAVQIIGKQKQYRQFVNLIEETRKYQPALFPWLQTYPLKALSFSEQWPKLLAVIHWLQTHPRPCIYLRQADIPGVDTKFIEQHRGILINLLDLCLLHKNIDSQAIGASRFEARYGFQQKPLRVRFRILDPELHLLPGQSGDITLTRQGLYDLGMISSILAGIEHIFITENEINFLAFPQICNSMVLFGAGYGFDMFSNIPWLSRPHKKQIHYWGDIDTHGFAILDQLREHLPQAHSLLMDKNTLLTHQAFWTQESKPEARHLPRLTQTEQQLYGTLRTNTLGTRIRLEQERIGFNHVLNTLRQIAIVID